MLVFENNVADGQLEIHGDADGLRRLIGELEGVLAEAVDPTAFKPAHSHLMTHAWGGSELNDKPQGKGEIVHHIKIYCWPS